MPIAPRMPIAIGRSNPTPSLRTLAGATLALTYFEGYPKPDLRLGLDSLPALLNSGILHTPEW